MSKRVAVITGGMGGLGETISTKMADAGYRVVVTYSPSNKTSDKWLDGHEGERLPLQCLCLRRHRFRRLEQSVRRAGPVAEVGPVDILVNNAGITAT